METSNGTTNDGTVFSTLRWLADLPNKVAVGLRTRPFATVAAIAGVSFVGGTLVGSRAARAVVVAATPVLLNRILDGQLGEDLNRYIRGAFRNRPATQHASS